MQPISRNPGRFAVALALLGFACAAIAQTVLDSPELYPGE